MKKLTTLLSLIVILSSNILLSQESISTKIIEPFQKDALLREKVFIHLNKSIYFTNETIWFTAYVVEDEKNTPSQVTSNLYVNLLNEKGDIIEQKIVFIKDGIGPNDFFVRDTLNSGTYYIQGFTNYMKNFGEDNRFIQKIKIINSASDQIAHNNMSLKSTPTTIIQEKNHPFNYDIQLFPESGYLLENNINTIGVKALINGKGFPFLGKIKNSKGDIINYFKGNELGMGKSTFNYDENETYTAVVNINNTTQIINVPKANKTGVIFNLDNSHENKLILTLKTNKQTLPSLKKSSLALLFYRNTHISQAVTLSLINNKETSQELIFDKNKMLHGVNVVTLFKDNQPIAERKFFINKKAEQTAILINKMNTKNDSISFKIKTINSKSDPVSSHLSISILPKKTKTFNENKTIKSAFLLTPYVKGSIEKPAYYFKNTNQKKKENLDLLLLNQGWSTYSLEEKIKEINPTLNHEFESGFNVKGKIKRYPKGYDIGIISEKGRLISSSEFNNNNEFSFENVFGFKNDTIKIALIKNKSPLVKPLKVSFISDSTIFNKFNIKPNRINQKTVITSVTPVSIEETNTFNFNDYPNIEVLQQINLKTIKSKKQRNFYDDEMEIASNRNSIAAGFYQGIKVTERMSDSYLNLLHYFQQLGMVQGNCPYNCILKLRSARYTFNVGGNDRGPNVFINNVRIDSESQIEVFQSTFMEEVDEILINRSGAGGGIEGVGGIVKIYLKDANHKYYKYGKTLYKQLVLLTGFDKAKDFYKPQYNIYTEDAHNWSQIGWENTVKTNENGEFFIKIPTNKFSNEFRFIINGFSENGLLFHSNYKTNDFTF